LDGNEEILSESAKATNLLKWSYIFQICKHWPIFLPFNQFLNNILVSEQWIIILLLSILILVLIYFKRTRRENVQSSTG
jgi:hypothetical protein